MISLLLLFAKYLAESHGRYLEAATRTQRTYTSANHLAESRGRKFDGESDSVKLMAQEAQEAWVTDSNVASAACDAIQRHHDTV